MDTRPTTAEPGASGAPMHGAQAGSAPAGSAPAGGAPRPSALRRLHAALGVVPLAIYLGWHLGELQLAATDRAGFRAHVFGIDGGAAAIAVEVGLVLVPLALHAALGVWLHLRHGAEAGPYRTVGMRRLQAVTGGVTLLFLAVHLFHTWVRKLAGVEPGLLYDQLRLELGRPAFLLLYAAGLACVCFHLAQGLGAAARTWSLARTDAGRRATRAVAAALGLAAWVLAVSQVSHFATGRAILGGDGASEVEQPASESAASERTEARP